MFKAIAVGGGMATSSRTADSLGLPGKTPMKVVINGGKTLLNGGGKDALNGLGDGAKVGAVNYVYKTAALVGGVGIGSLLVAGVGEKAEFNLLVDAVVNGNRGPSFTDWDRVSEEVFFGK